VVTFMRELVHVGLYKRSQGRITRQVTCAALVVTLMFGLWRFHTLMVGHGEFLALGVPLLAFAAGAWVSYRAVNMPAFADFLIAVEAEVNKVSWPTWPELFRASIVVLVFIVSLAVILACFDMIWYLFFHHVLHII
jgi:preprotein translocase subunit SecE